MFYIEKKITQEKDDFAVIIGNILIETIPVPLLESITMREYEAKFKLIKNTLDWKKEQLIFFEEGILVYPKCAVYVDIFQNYSDRREFCIMREERYPSAIKQFSYNKLYKDRINNVLMYVQLFLPDDKIANGRLNQIRKLYDHRTSNGWAEYERTSIEIKKKIAELTTKLALYICKVELK
jgi:hypothetical protein